MFLGPQELSGFEVLRVVATHPYLEDHPRTCKWLITMVRFRPLRIGLVPSQMAVLWLINGGDPNYLLSGMILQVEHTRSAIPLANYERNPET